MIRYYQSQSVRADAEKVGEALLEKERQKAELPEQTRIDRDRALALEREAVHRQIECVFNTHSFLLDSNKEVTI